MDRTSILAELQKINQAIAAQEALHGTLSDEQLAANLASLRRKQAELNAQLATLPPSSQAAAGGIQANRIEADNVVQGMQQLGGDLSGPAEALALAEALNKGTITADSIQARNVVAGFQYIADPTQATSEELRQEIAFLQQQLAEAIAAGELEDNADMSDAQEALENAEVELAQEQPQGNRIKRKLKEASDILTTGAGTAAAAGKLGEAVIKLAPVAAALYQISTNLFGG